MLISDLCSRFEEVAKTQNDEHAGILQEIIGLSSLDRLTKNLPKTLKGVDSLFKYLILEILAKLHAIGNLIGQHIELAGGLVNELKQLKIYLKDKLIERSANGAD